MNTPQSRNFLDRMIEYISPSWALNREKARFLAGNFYKFNGASMTSNIMRNNTPGLGSANMDYPKGERDILTARCRDAYRNKPVAKGCIDRLKHWTIGTGLKLQSRINFEALGMTQDEASIWERKIESHFDHWCKHCDLQGFANFRQMQAITFLTVLISGDAFTHTMYEYTPGSLYTLKLQSIDPDRVCNPNYSYDTKYQRRGIDISENGKPISYNVMTQHPNDEIVESPTWMKIPVYGGTSGARRFFHHVERERAEQFRGIPYLAPVLEPLMKLEKYSEAELTAAIVASLFTVFVKKEGGYGIPQTTATTDGAYGTEAQKADELALGEGAIMNLLPNESIEVANPTRPNTGYDSFWLSIMKQIGAALSMPLDVILLVFSSSYSAARAALLTAWKFIEYERAFMIDSFCQPIYELWFEEFAEKHDIDISDIMMKEAWIRSAWIGSPRGAIDEKREITAATERINAGVSTIQLECEQISGADWYDVQLQRGYEESLRKSLNLKMEENKNESDEKLPFSDNDFLK